MLNINIKGLAFVTTLGCRAPYSRTFMIFWTQNRSNTFDAWSSSHGVANCNMHSCINVR